MKDREGAKDREKDIYIERRRERRIEREGESGGER